MTSVLHIYLLGEFLLLRDETPLPNFHSERIQSLLVYLLLHRHAPQPRLHLAFLLWPDSTESQARTNLRNLLHQLRRVLPDADQWLDVQSTTLQWRLDAPFTLDVAAFQEAVSRANAASDLQTAHEAFEAAVALYKGDLQTASYEEWLLPAREALRQSFLASLERLVTLLEEAGDFRAAIRYAQRLVQVEPLQESSYVQLMRLHALSGDRAGVVRVYQLCASMLEAELGVEPSSATQQAYKSLLQVQAAAPLPPQTAETPPALVPHEPSRPHIVLPTSTTPFVGRERELAELAELLAAPDCRLLMLVGPGGTGKTRIALELATQQATHWADGAAFVPLAAVASTDLLVPTIASGVGVTLSGVVEPQAQLLHFLEARQVLLVLDNFEHLMDGVELLVAMLEQAPMVKLIVTSRERLNLHGEWLYEVPGFPVPESAHDSDAEASGALALFAQSARRVRPGFAITPAERPSIIRICQLVEGMPLGIELAAAWARVLPATDIAREIERNVDFLATSTRDAPPRHRSVRAVFEHSWKMLADNECQAIIRLAIFRGSFGREAAAEVAGTSLVVLGALMDKSLLRRNSAMRYDMHELIRQYALEKLHESGEMETINHRYATYYWTFVAQAAAQLHSVEQAAWLERLEQELGNIRAVLEWSFETEPPAPEARVERGLEAASSIYRFWQGRGHLTEGRRWLERGAYHPSAAATRTRAAALDVLGWLVNHFGEVDLATTILQESLVLSRQLDDQKGAATALDSLGDVAWGRGAFEEARGYYTESLALRRELGEPATIGVSLYSLGRLHVDHGYNAEATLLLEEGLALLQSVGDQRGISLSLHGLGRVALQRGEYALAKRHVQAALHGFYTLGNRIDIAECLEVLAIVAGREGDWARAAQLLGAGTLIREAVGVTIPTIRAEEVEAIRQALGESAFLTFCQEGRSMPVEQAIALASGGETVTGS